MISTHIIRLSEGDALNEDDIAQIERYTCLMYHKASGLSSVNACRRQLFVQYGRSIESCPPTQDALIQHIRRAMLQCRYLLMNIFKLTFHLYTFGLNNTKYNELCPPIDFLIYSF